MEAGLGILPKDKLNSYSSKEAVLSKGEHYDHNINNDHNVFRTSKMVKEAPGSSNKKGKMYDRTINIDHSVNRNINNYTNIKINSNINKYNRCLSSVLPWLISNYSNVLISNLPSNNSKVSSSKESLDKDATKRVAGHQEIEIAKSSEKV